MVKTWDLPVIFPSNQSIEKMFPLRQDSPEVAQVNAGQQIFFQNQLGLQVRQWSVMVTPRLSKGHF